MPTSVWVVNLVVLGVILEADLGRRRVGWFRVLRPLAGTAAVVVLYLSAVPTSGHNVALYAAGVGAGVILGLASHLFVTIHYDDVRGRPVSRARFGYAGFWVVIFAARLGFVYGAEHLFSGALGQFLVAHQLSVAGLTDALIFMAIAMALARSVLLEGRALAVCHAQAARQVRTA